MRFVVCEVALALDFLRSRCSIVHRDVKPDNILLDADGHAHLTDFNVAVRMVQQQQQEGGGGEGQEQNGKQWSLELSNMPYIEKPITP